MNLKLRCKLSAYTKGILPTKLSELINDTNFIADAPNDDKVYARQNLSWVELQGSEFGDKIGLLAHSGLILDREGSNVNLGINQWIGNESDLPEIEIDKTYYVIEHKADIFINGGTSFSNGYYDSILEENIATDFGQIISGGNANTITFELDLLPVNSRGEY